MSEKQLNVDLNKKIDRLKVLRESISLSLADIAMCTKIPTQLLKDIESKKFDNLPPEPIGPSFIQQYANQVESHFDDTDFEVIS